MRWILLGAGVLAGTALTLVLLERHFASKAARAGERDEHTKRFGRHEDRDLVEEASWESFPASDPPSW